MSKVCGIEVTLPDPKDNQAVYDYICRWLLEIQGRESRESCGNKTMCYYRLPQPNGKTLACAVGCLAPDEDYERWWETRSIGAFADYFNSKGYNLPFLQRMQEAHDSEYGELPERLQRPAEAYNLRPYVKAA